MENDTILVIIVGPHVVDTIKTHHINFYSIQLLIIIVENAG